MTRSGTLLPAQVLYAGKSDHCLPENVFPEDWDPFYTESHWSNEDSMVRFVERIVVPYVTSVRETLPLRQCEQPAIAIFDVYKAHRSPLVLDALRKNGILPLFVPACCTDRLQPLDLTVNKDFKDLIKAKFQEWHTAQVMDQLDRGVEEPVDTSFTAIKRVHASWIVSAHTDLALRRQLIVRGFEKAGI